MISVIIPCFNTGLFLNEAINSVFDSSKEKFEIIVVNDGSTDEDTIEIINSISDPSISVIHQENKGLAAARNVGVGASKGDFLFFLDSDNRVLPGYDCSAIREFARNPSVGVVYGNPIFFGESEDEPRFKSGEYSFDRLLIGNFIDACAFVRRSAFESVGGFSVDERLQGWDDWDLWIKIHLAKWEFKYLNKDCFEYRVRRDSMIGNSTEEKKQQMLKYLGGEYGYFFHQKYRQYFRVMEQIQRKPFYYFLRILYYNYFKSTPFIK
jgi:glycosyltransferase involved in cell wall biosynthesis